MDWSQATKALSEPLDPAHIANRKQGGAMVDYIEGWHAIAEANRIFGFGEWTRETVESRCVSERERKIGRDQKDGWGVTYVARVRITVGNVTREGCGAGHGIGIDLGECHESAIKEAETDAMKRAFMTFGNPFGLALYDKKRDGVAVPTLNATQAETIKSLLKETDANHDAFLEHAGAESVEKIAAAKFDFLRTQLQVKLAKQREKTA